MAARATDFAVTFLPNGENLFITMGYNFTQCPRQTPTTPGVSPRVLPDDIFFINVSLDYLEAIFESHGGFVFVRGRCFSVPESAKDFLKRMKKTIELCSKDSPAATVSSTAVGPDMRGSYEDKERKVEVWGTLSFWNSLFAAVGFGLGVVFVIKYDTAIYGSRSNFKRV
jgi:hypothetical protein